MQPSSEAPEAEGSQESAGAEGVKILPDAFLPDYPHLCH